jgi:molecular chaperone DnaK
MDSGFPILLADAAGARLTPSVVHFSAKGEPMVGQPALRMQALEPAATILLNQAFCRFEWRSTARERC